MINDVLDYWREFGFFSLLRKIPVKLYQLLTESLRSKKQEVLSEADILNRRLMPLSIFNHPGHSPCVNLVLDLNESDKPELDTALLCAALLASEWNYGMRIISSPHVNKNHFHELLTASHIPFRKNLDFIYLNMVGEGNEIACCRGDVFITCSWVTTCKVIGSIDANRVIYLVQKDEGLLESSDHSRALCTDVLKNKQINFLVIAEKLYMHLISAGFENIREAGVWTENFPTDSSDGSRIVQNSDELLRSLSGFLERIKTDVSG